MGTLSETRQGHGDFGKGSEVVIDESCHRDRPVEQ